MNKEKKNEGEKGRGTERRRDRESFLTSCSRASLPRLVSLAMTISFCSISAGTCTPSSDQPDNRDRKDVSTCCIGYNKKLFEAS